MPRPRKPDAMTPAERSRAWRADQRHQGSHERSVRLTPENVARADALALARGVSFSVLVNDLIAAAALPS